MTSIAFQPPEVTAATHPHAGQQPPAPQRANALPPPPPQQLAAAPREPHALSLKVLRTARPSLAQNSVLPYHEPTSLGAQAFDALAANSVEQRGDFVLSGALSLPSTFGTIYLGETFSALLSLSHDLSTAPQAMTPVLKIEMHTGTPAAPVKHHLRTIHGPAPANALSSGESMEGLVQHEIKDLGQHALVCTVTYGVRPPGGAGTILSRSFRKVYKFAVSNPLSVRTKAYALPSTSPPLLKIYLEVQIQNHASHALNFTRCHLDPVPSFHCQPIESPNPSNSNPPTMKIEPVSVRQLLFLLSSSSPPPAEPGTTQPLGKLDLAWTSPNGEHAKLQTSMLGRRIPETSSVGPIKSYTILPAPSAPAEVVVHVPFVHSFVLDPLPSAGEGQGDAEVSVSVEQFKATDSLAPYGKARVKVGSDGRFKLGWLPLEVGLVEGIKVKILVAAPGSGEPEPVVVETGLSVWVKGT